MNNSRIKNIVNLSAAERYGYFIRKVSDFEEVWGLKDKEGITEVRKRQCDVGCIPIVKGERYNSYCSRDNC